MRKYLVWLVFVVLLVFTRFYNLNLTARFTEDESKDLVGIHQIFVDKKLTLVGPTNEQGTKVFSSLTFYMLLPFAIIGKFDPVSPHYGAAFWGTLTAILIVYFVNKINSKFTFLTMAVALVWFPLLETGRWAWNPNLIPLWVILGITLTQIPNKYFKLLAGISFGLAVHSHYYAIFAVGLFMILISLFLIYKNKYSEAIFLFVGFILLILPFLLFDLRHPPGIFMTNLFSQSKSIGEAFDTGFILHKFLANMWSLMMKYTQSIYLAIPLSIFIFILFFQDIKKRFFSLIYLIPWIFQSIVVAFIPQFFPHYLIPGLIFFVIWVIYKRSGVDTLLSYLILVTLLTGGIFSVYSQLTKPTSIPDIATARKIEQNIKKELSDGDLKNVNIAVLSSPDHTTSGKKYRDLLLVDGNTHILTKDEYNITDHLFVISTSGEKSVRLDPASEMHRFNKGLLVGSDKIGNSGWLIYHFTRSI